MMVVLTEQIEIPASYEKMEAWTANFEEEFVKWSPYHIECNLYNGNYHAGSKVRFREIVMGLDYDVTGTITECEQDTLFVITTDGMENASRRYDSEKVKKMIERQKEKYGQTAKCQAGTQKIHRVRCHDERRI